MMLLVLNIVMRMINLAKTSEREGSKKVDDELNIAWSKNHKSLPLNPADIIIITDSKLEEAYAKFI